MLFSPFPLPPLPSRRQPPRIPREKRRLPNIIQPQKELHDAIQPQPPAPMRRAPPPERLGVMPEPVIRGIEPLERHARGQVGVVVDALRARHDLLAAHEEVVGVCEERVCGGGVGVEGPEGAGVLVYGVEVCGVLGEDEAAEGAFLGCAVWVGKGLVGGRFFFWGGRERKKGGGRGKLRWKGMRTLCLSEVHRRRCRLLIGGLWLLQR